ncbi:hypothetical protein [Tautonia plasticadhaerens]|uniref:hypothetical protein n=1 Tax=Tautonia plasticadhaerens TaxID=2527974 RepID=UPI0011A3653D|nr:hypothetical protein [Tautonia plasticadhaerens]
MPAGFLDRSQIVGAVDPAPEPAGERVVGLQLDEGGVVPLGDLDPVEGDEVGPDDAGERDELGDVEGATVRVQQLEVELVVEDLGELVEPAFVQADLDVPAIMPSKSAMGRPGSP